MASDAEKVRNNILHMVEFTKDENKAGLYFLRGWFVGAALSASEVDDEKEKGKQIVKAANDVWALRVSREHFKSELDSDPHTRLELSKQADALFEANALAAEEKLNALIGHDTDEDERMNKLVEDKAAEILQKLGL